MMPRNTTGCLRINPPDALMRLLEGDLVLVKGACPREGSSEKTNRSRLNSARRGALQPLDKTFHHFQPLLKLLMGIDIHGAAADFGVQFAALVLEKLKQ